MNHTHHSSHTHFLGHTHRSGTPTLRLGFGSDYAHFRARVGVSCDDVIDDVIIINDGTDDDIGYVLVIHYIAMLCFLISIDDVL